MRCGRQDSGSDIFSLIRYAKRRNFKIMRNSDKIKGGFVLNGKISLMERLQCPVCGKRAADVNSDGNVELELKCPHCHKLVKVKYAGHRTPRVRRA